MAAISLRELRKSYGEDEVIHGVSCDIADGEFTVIVGPSGCGKSTLLRMVAGLEEVTAGEISIGGRVVNDVEPADRDIAMVFQNYALYPHMTVFGNMAYGLRIRRIDKAEIARRVEKTAAILELGDLLDRRPRQLSGGQRQRVAMGRAIVREPAVFLFDEPLSNLDAKLRVQMRLEIKKLHEALGTTSLYVTHDQIEAMTLGQRLIVMNAGVAEQIGAPLDIYRRPASIFVAGFIGSPAMNFMPATARGGSVELAGGVRLTLAGGGAGAADGRPVTLGIRPEHLEITGADGGIIQLKVGMVEALGADTLVHGMLNGAGPDSGHRLTARIPGGRAVAPGDSLSLTVDPAHLHLFDPDTGKRVEID